MIKQQILNCIEELEKLQALYLAEDDQVCSDNMGDIIGTLMWLYHDEA